VSFWGVIPGLLRMPCRKHDKLAILERQYLAFSGIIPPGPKFNPRMPKYGAHGISDVRQHEKVDRYTNADSVYETVSP
jgi:hypothetical protein